ncbi:MAG TPA: hypothetical protein VMT68_00100 [Caulobacteraceae bacterium]|nr:hypothetical protein [Caulobacteraceae bacterium]
MTIRTSLFGGAALGAVVALALAPAADAKPKHHRHAAAYPASESVRNEVEELEAKVQSLEAWKEQQAAAQSEQQAQVHQLQSQLADANARAAHAEQQVAEQIQTIPGTVQAEVAKAKPKPGWWDATSVSGRMYYDLTNIDESSNIGNGGLSLSGNGGHSPDGFHFDIKRFYVSVDHKFNDVFSADVTTDFLYDSGAGATQLYLKKAYLQAKVSDALVFRLGATDLPWIPFDEDVYGLRYIENTLIDRTKFGTSSDWGVHALGTTPIGASGATFSYDLAAINGAGYKKPGFIGGVNRSKGMDFEGRVNVNYKGLVVAIGGYDGKLGADFNDIVTFHNATRFDALVAYSNKMFKIGGEYMWANADVNSGQITTPIADNSDGYEIFGDINLAPKVMIFGRYDWLKPRRTTTPALLNTYYNFGIQYEPTKIVDFALVYKHDQIDNGAFGDQNFATTAANGRGDYDEVGLFGQFRW